MTVQLHRLFRVLNTDGRPILLEWVCSPTLLLNGSRDLNYYCPPACCVKTLNNGQPFLSLGTEQCFPCDSNQPHKRGFRQSTDQSLSVRLSLITEWEVRAGPHNQLPGLGERYPAVFIIVSPGVACFYNAR